MNARKVLLIGGGHAHVAVLADWARRGLPGEAAVLTPYPTLRYSGMVPGWIAGQYDAGTGLVDVAALAKAARVEFIQGRCAGIDPEKRLAFMEEGGAVSFDIASIDTGGVGRAERVLGADPRLLDIRPIDGFVERLARWRAGWSGASPRIAIIGGGAGGVELTFAMRNAHLGDEAQRVVFVAGEAGLLPDFSDAVRHRVAHELSAQQVAMIESDARLVGGTLTASGQSLEPIDLIIAALGSAAPAWPRESGLACDEQGFIAVDRHQRSTSHPHILAVGDVAARIDRPIPHSGVHAVFAGPVLAANIRALCEGREPGGVYTPRWNNLYLMTTGKGEAIASYGPFAAQGRWVQHLKHWIDTRWLEKYAKLAGNV